MELKTILGELKINTESMQLPDGALKNFFKVAKDDATYCRKKIEVAWILLLGMSDEEKSNALYELYIGDGAGLDQAKIHELFHTLVTTAVFMTPALALGTN